MAKRRKSESPEMRQMFTEAAEGVADLRPIELLGAAMSPPVALAPLAGITDLPFRTLVASFGGELGGLRDGGQPGDGPG
jgi:hypothetical protein